MSALGRFLPFMKGCCRPAGNALKCPGNWGLFNAVECSYPKLSRRSMREYLEAFDEDWQLNSGLRIDHLLMNHSFTPYLIAVGADT